MRELKSRQWVNGRFHYFGFIDGSWIGPATPDIKNNPVGQYIGLHDKNGNEIYEDDIVTVLDYGFYVVSWEQNIAAFGMRQDGYYRQSFFSTEKLNYTVGGVKIVGNRYENPELLEGNV